LAGALYVVPYKGQNGLPMKHFLLSILLVFSLLLCRAQESGVSHLPAGKYETVVKSNDDKWERGDIFILDGNRYRISTSDEVGEYKFSMTAQRVFFTSGPLKNLFAKTSMKDNTPVIVLPAAENVQAGVRNEIWCYHRQ
jgi:hypothetical protein